MRRLDRSTGTGRNQRLAGCRDGYLKTACLAQAWGGPLACGTGKGKEGDANGWSGRSAGAAGMASLAEVISMKSSRALSSRQSSHSATDSASSCPSISSTCASRASWATSNSRQTRTTRAGDRNRSTACSIFPFFRRALPVPKFARHYPPDAQTWSSAATAIASLGGANR